MDQDSEEQYPSFSQAMGKDVKQEESERLIKRIVAESDGTLCSVDEAVETLLYVDKKQRKRVPWKADLTIGSHLSIKISAFIYVSIRFYSCNFFSFLNIEIDVILCIGS